MEKLPIYRWKVDAEDESEITAVALVDMPAIEMNWHAFTGELRFKADEQKQIISGPLMVAGLPIYRRNETGEYYGIFEAEDIYNLRNKFSKNQNGSSVNKMHDPSQTIDGVYMIESFIIDSERGINSPNGFKLPNGSWFGSYKVDNKDVWDNFINNGEFKGFSVEGMFKEVQVDAKPLSIIEQVIDIIKAIQD